MPEPVPPLMRNASLASIMHDKGCAAPGVDEPEAAQSSSRGRSRSSSVGTRCSEEEGDRLGSPFSFTSRGCVTLAAVRVHRRPPGGVHRSVDSSN